MQIIGVMSLLLLVTACGKSNSNAGLPVQKEQVLPVNGSNIYGLYMAKFQTLNPLVNGTIPGSATIQRDQDKFYAYVRVFGGAPGVLHQQNIYEGRRCPTLSDDANGDGYIDIEEGNRVWGNVLIPLDANINSQALGRNIYPVADASGTYYYERVGSFHRMFEDLHSEDKNSTDNVVKLDPTKGFDIEGRVVVIQGTSDTGAYPDSVATVDGKPAHQTLPIACGIFTKITEIPGDLEDDSTTPPGPVDPVPAPSTPSTPSTPTTGTGGTHSDTSDHSDDSDWFGRLRDWWRDHWTRESAGHSTDWGNG